MQKYNLGFISDEDIYAHVKETVISYRREIIKQAIADECFRQIDKSNSNNIGYFYQNIFRYAGNGWVVPKAGFDVENDSLHIYAELKNKHNTMNPSSLRKTYIKMQAKLLDDDQATCYLVEVIAKKSRDDAWNVSLEGRTLSHKRIRRISMDRFFGLVFGDEKAFYKLCVALPQIIEDVVNDDEELAIKNTVYEELTREHADLLTSLYLLAFSTYEGFEHYMGN